MRQANKIYIFIRSFSIHMSDKRRAFTLSLRNIKEQPRSDTPIKLYLVHIITSNIMMMKNYYCTLASFY